MSEQRVPYLMPAAPRPRRRQRKAEPLVLLTPNQAAALLAVSVKTVYRLLQRGDVPSIKVGASIRVRQDRLLEYLEQREESGR